MFQCLAGARNFSPIQNHSGLFWGPPNMGTRGKVDGAWPCDHSHLVLRSRMWICPCANYEAIWESGCNISTYFFTVGTGWCWVISVTTRERDLSRSGSFGDKNLFPLPRIEPRFISFPAASLVCVPSTQSWKTKIQNDANRYFRRGYVMLQLLQPHVRRQHGDVRMITAISISDLCVMIISGDPMHSTSAFIFLQWTVPWFQQNYEGVIRTYVTCKDKAFVFFNGIITWH
jgi:hypothetical protein